MSEWRVRKRSFGNITTKTAGDIASEVVSTLYGKITDKIDPIVIGEMQRAVEIALHYGFRLGVPSNLINHLVTGYPSHGFVIDVEEALDIFPNCEKIGNYNRSILYEIQKIFITEFGSDYTSIPHPEGLFANVNFSIKEQKNEDKNYSEKQSGSVAEDKGKGETNC